MGSNCTTDSMTVYYPHESVQKLQEQRRNNTPQKGNSSPQRVVAMHSGSLSQESAALLNQQQQQQYAHHQPNYPNAISSGGADGQRNLFNFAAENSAGPSTFSDYEVRRGIALNPFRQPQMSGSHRKTRSRDTSFGGTSTNSQQLLGASGLSSNNDGQQFAAQQMLRDLEPGPSMPLSRPRSSPRMPTPLQQQHNGGHLLTPFERGDAFSEDVGQHHQQEQHEPQRDEEDDSDVSLAPSPRGGENDRQLLPTVHLFTAHSS